MNDHMLAGFAEANDCTCHFCGRVGTRWGVQGDTWTLMSAGGMWRLGCATCWTRLMLNRDEDFCPDCFAGMESSQHLTTCGEG